MILMIDALPPSFGGYGGDPSFDHVIFRDSSRVYGTMGVDVAGTPHLQQIYYDGRAGPGYAVASKAITLAQWLLAYWVVDTGANILTLDIGDGSPAAVAIDPTGFIEGFSSATLFGGVEAHTYTDMKLLDVMIAQYAYEFTRAEAVSYANAEYPGIGLT